jgi:hypothetical protein
VGSSTPLRGLVSDHTPSLRLVDGPAAAQSARGGCHLHFHGLPAAEVAALLRGDGDSAVLRREDVAAVPAAEDRTLA